MKKYYFIITFVLLFAFYHLAEYFVMFKNNALFFFLFQGLFFLTAYIMGKIIDKKGLSTWGFKKSRNTILQIFIGLLVGIILYGIPFLVCLFFGIEKIEKIPSLGNIITPTSLFLFGIIFSSVSEDILTRGIFYKVFRGKISNILIILITSFVYFFNHIYKLTSGWETFFYIFLLGVVFSIAMIETKHLWMTSAMHWAGNATFYITHQVFSTVEYPSNFEFNSILSILMIIFILFYTIYKLILIQKQNKLNES